MNSFPEWSYSLINDCADAIVAQDLRGRIVGCNPAAERLFGYAAVELVGQTVSLLQAADTTPGSLSALLLDETLLLNQVRQGRSLNLLPMNGRHRDGQSLSLLLTLSPIRDTEGNIVGASHLIRNTEQSLVDTQQFLALAYRDPLTGLSNRSHLLDRLEQAMRRDERSHQFGAVLFIDLNQFKNVNDTAGHMVGDRILVRAGKRLQARMRKCDTIARWGGDEFVVLVEDLGATFDETVTRAAAIADKVVETLSQPHQLNGRLHRCPPSVGVTLFRGVTEPTSKVIERADKAMYHAKSEGRHGHYFIDTTPPEEGSGNSRSDTVAA